MFRISLFRLDLFDRSIFKDIDYTCDRGLAQ